MEILNIKKTFIEDYCKNKGYQVVHKEISYGIKLEISNLSEKASLVLYNTGKIVPEGNPNSLLRKELEQLKQEIIDNPEILKRNNDIAIKSCNQKYEVISIELQEKIKNLLSSSKGSTPLALNQNDNEIYRVKILQDSSSLTAIQYKTGTLLIQGKKDLLFDDICTSIEKISAPTGKEVVIRFLADNKEALDSINATFSPDLLNRAEVKVKSILGDDIFNFIEEHDRKYLIASECLRICEIPLPEFSPVVMPASKAFEGFAKKVLISIEFYPSNHFDDKTASFSYLNDKRHANRNTLINKEAYAGSFLDKISLCLEENRNFMMHSNSSLVTKVNTLQEASNKLDDISKEMKEIYHYFKSHSIFGL